MRQTLALACFFGFLAVTASVYAVPEQESAIDSAFDDEIKCAAQEAILVGEILSDVASQLAEDEDLSAETEEYFIRTLWQKTKSAVKNATAKVKAAAKDAYKDAKAHLKAAAKEMKHKANQKALAIVEKIFGKSTESYALEDSDSLVDFVTAVSTDIKRAAQRLQKQGMSLLEI